MALDYRTLLVFPLVTASLIFAQNMDVRVAGRVTDTSGAVLAHVSVKLYSRTSPESYSATADDQGNYALFVPEGEYLLDATAPGLSLTKSPRHVSIKTPTDLPIEMGVAEASTAVQVTATGTAQSFDETAKAMDVVGREELDQRGIESAADALREVPGLRVEQRGGPGTNTTIQIRGLRTFDTAVLIDGMRFRDVGATQGDASSFITDLLVVDTSKIEILRGAGSSLYGTNAIGGVVNMVTDSGGGALHGNLTADGGGLGEFRTVARLGGVVGDRLHYSGGMGHQEVTDGVGGYGRYRNTTGNGLADYTFRPGLVLSARFLGTNAYGELYETAGAAPAATLPPTGYIPAVALSPSQILLAEKSLPYTLAGATFIPALGDPDYFRTAQFLSSLIALQDQMSARLSFRLSYQALLSNRDVVNGPLGAGFQPAFRNSSEFNGRIDTMRGQANYAWGAHQILSGGYEFEREYFDSPASDNNPNPAMQVNSRVQVAERSNSFDAQDQIRLLRDRLQISLSGRIQDFSLDKPLFLGTVPVYAGVSAVSPPNAYTADASIAYFIHSSGTKIRSHGGNGYRKPSLYELFGTSFSGSTFTAYGDPRLKPERSIAIDGGVDQYFASDRLRFSASYFYTRLQQVIAFDSSGLITPATDPFGRSSGYRNTGGGIARGVELSGEARPRRGTQLRASYTYTNARDKYSEFVDGTLQIPRITPNSFSLVVLQQFGKHVDASFEFLAASDFLYQLSRRTFVFPGPRQGVFTAGYTRPLTEKINMRFNVRINNILDQLYFEDGYRTPRRWATGGVSFSF
jgi:iron complex outermembrane receptor protein